MTVSEALIAQRQTSNHYLWAIFIKTAFCKQHVTEHPPGGNQG